MPSIDSVHHFTVSCHSSSLSQLYLSLNLHSPSETSSAINKTSVDVCTNVRFDDEENEKSQPPADGVNKLVIKEKTKRDKTLFTESPTAVDRKTIVGVQCDSVLSESSNELSSLEASEISNKVAYLQHLRELSLSTSDAARTGAVDVRLKPNISISAVSERFAETTGLSNKHNRAASTHEGVKRKQVGDEELDNKTLPRIGASGNGSKETSGRRPQGIEPVKLARETADKTEDKPEDCSKVASGRRPQRLETVKPATRTSDKAENEPESYSRVTSGRRPQRKEPAKEMANKTQNTTSRAESLSTNQHITICKKERVTTCEVIPSELLGTTNSMLQTEESTVDHHLQTW